MADKHYQGNELNPPPIAQSNPDSIEILRVWTAPNSPQQMVLQTCWKDPGAWGLMLADLARHAANAYERSGDMSSDEALARILELFEAEWASPTDRPKDVSD